MVLLYPWSLLALAAVAAVAAWAFFRPGSQLAVVPSLWLWRQAAEKAHRDARRSRHRVSAAWLLLLMGCVLAAVASSRPVLRSLAPARSVTLEVRPSAELADPQGQGLADLKRAARAVLARLGGSDRVDLLLPAQAGAQQERRWRSPAEASAALETLGSLPVPDADLAFAPPADASQHVYRIGAAGEAAGPPSAARVTQIVLPVRLGPASLESAAARPTAQGQAEVFVAVRNHQSRPWSGRVVVRSASLGADRNIVQTRVWEQAMTIQPRGRATAVRSLPAAPAFTIEVEDEAPPGPGRHAYLVRKEIRRGRVALTGPDEPLLRRFIQADERLDLTGEADSADIVFANARPPPPGKPALVINPPAPPPGWTSAEALAETALAGADVDDGDALVRGVSLGGIAVRSARPWRPGEQATQKAVASLRGRALVVREEPTGRDLAGVRRVYVAFDLSAENTNFGLTQDFPIFLGNVVDFLLAGAGAGEVSYETLTPAQAAARWPHVMGLPWPGLYVDRRGAMQAVSLLGLRGAGEAPDAAAQAAGAVLPEPAPIGRQVELWPLLLGLALTAWLAGWVMRVR